MSVTVTALSEEFYGGTNLTRFIQKRVRAVLVTEATITAAELDLTNLVSVTSGFDADTDEVVPLAIDAAGTSILIADPADGSTGVAISGDLYFTVSGD